MQENYENHGFEFGSFSWQLSESENEIPSRTLKIIDLNRFLFIEIAYYH